MLVIKVAVQTIFYLRSGLGYLVEFSWDPKISQFVYGRMSYPDSRYIMSIRELSESN